MYSSVIVILDIHHIWPLIVRSAKICQLWFIQAADVRGSPWNTCKENRLPSPISHVLPEDMWHDTSTQHWQEWLTFQPITVKSFLPRVVSSGLSITMSALVLVYWFGWAVLRVSVSSAVSLSGFFCFLCSVTSPGQYVCAACVSGQRTDHCTVLLVVLTPLCSTNVSTKSTANTAVHTWCMVLSINGLSASQSVKTAHVRY